MQAPIQYTCMSPKIAAGCLLNREEGQNRTSTNVLEVTLTHSTYYFQGPRSDFAICSYITGGGGSFYHVMFHFFSTMVPNPFGTVDQWGGGLCAVCVCCTCAHACECDTPLCISATCPCMSVTCPLREHDMPTVQGGGGAVICFCGPVPGSPWTDTGLQTGS